MEAVPDIRSDSACRLCGGATTPLFEGLVLDKYRVSYLRCQLCGSLQTEKPYWLNEAYVSFDRSIDPGAARRVLDSFALVSCIARLLNARRLLDFGGNTGLLCRLLRDRGYDAYTFDRYIDPVYAPQFTGDAVVPRDLLTAFEVIEHFSDPNSELDAIFRTGHRAILVTTELYSEQSPGWWYLAPREGQHVFFYSEAAIKLIAVRYGYSLEFGHGYLLFSRDPLGWMQRLTVRWLLRQRFLRIFGAVLLARRGSGAQRDYDVLVQRDAHK